jgi:hypothetical protein
MTWDMWKEVANVFIMGFAAGMLITNVAYGLAAKREGDK